MDEDRKWLQTFLCDIVELKSKKKKLYRKASADCDDPVGKEIFDLLQREEAESVRGLQLAQKKLEEDKKLDPTCVYHPEEMSPADMVIQLAEKQIKSGNACSKHIEALEVGISLEQQAIQLIEKYLPMTESNEEKKILDLLLEEDKEHFRALKDLQFYFSDPQGWLMEKGRGGLDGA